MKNITCENLFTFNALFVTRVLCDFGTRNRRFVLFNVIPSRALVSLRYLNFSKHSLAHLASSESQDT